MFTIVLRSICVGIAFVVGAFFIGIFLGIPIVLYIVTRNANHFESGEVGWDLVTLAHNYPVRSILVPSLIFVIGFIFGFRHFSK
jgi:hypothetical protein